MLKTVALGLVFVALLLIAGCASGVSSADRAKSHHKMAQSYLATKDYTSALQELLAAEQLAPADPEIQASLGTVYFHKKAYSQSEKHYLKSLQLLPADPNTQNNLAALYLETQRWSEAAVLFRSAADNLLFHYPVRALIGLGVAYHQDGQHLKAVLAYNEALQLVPANSLVLRLLAETYYAMGKYELARQRLEEVVRLEPNNNTARFLLGQSCMQLDDREAAAEAFREVANREDGSARGRQAREYLTLLDVGL